VSFSIADDLHLPANQPPLERDAFWDHAEQGQAVQLPYTVAAQKFQREPFLGSTANLVVSARHAEPAVTIRMRQRPLSQRSRNTVSSDSYQLQPPEVIVPRGPTVPSWASAPALVGARSDGPLN